MSQISYAWLQQYGLPINANTDSSDPDGDGLTNWQEWRCLTDPTNALSAVIIWVGLACAGQGAKERPGLGQKGVTVGEKLSSSRFSPLARCPALLRGLIASSRRFRKILTFSLKQGRFTES